VRTTARVAPATPFAPMTINRQLLGFCRTVHIYLTMLGVFVMLLFGVTGFTINHEGWFGATTPVVVDATEQTPPALLAQPDHVRLVEYLRQTHHIGGALTNFDDLGDRLALSFREPGRKWELEITKDSGQTTFHRETFNFFAVINDLHRGRDAGAFWRWVIDLSAFFIVLACVTGFVLWLALPKRRKLGVLVLVLGTLGTLAFYYTLVPGPDEDAKTPEPVAPASVDKN